jgi:tetratricopeptide (TPR) repeat protein
LSRFLVESGVYRVTFSFSGSTSEKYENIYIGSEFSRVLGNIKALAEAKKEAGSLYPRIDINSLAFRHHLERIVDFVDLMADHGANHIHLKPVTGYEDIPELHGHLAVNRPWVEGHLLAKARERARARGVGFGTVAFDRLRVGSAEEEQEKLSARVLNYTKGARYLPGQTIPVTELKQRARQRAAERAPAVPASAPPPSVLDIPPENVDSYLGMHKPEQVISTPCLEPFKTFYATRNGAVKPCCFSPGHIESLGNITSHDAVTIWRGAGYRAMREGVVAGRYPAAFCEKCVPAGGAPKWSGLKVAVNEYAKWHERRFRAPFAPDLQLALATQPSPATNAYYLLGQISRKAREINQHGEQLAQAGEWMPARKAFAKALDLMPGMAEYHSNHGAAAWAQGMYEDALASFARAYELNPSNDAIVLNCARAMHALGESGRARDLCRSFLSAHPGSVEMRRLLDELEQTRAIVDDESSLPASLETK